VSTFATIGAKAVLLYASRRSWDARIGAGEFIQFREYSLHETSTVSLSQMDGKTTTASPPSVRLPSHSRMGNVSAPGVPGGPMLLPPLSPPSGEAVPARIRLRKGMPLL